MHKPQWDRWSYRIGCPVAEWLDRLSVLVDANRFGPTFLQLAPSFYFAYLPQLSSFLKQLPSDSPWAVEVRHQDWFDQAS